MNSSLYWGNRQDALGGFPRDLWESLRPRWRQIHGTAIAEVTGPGQECGEVDGLWTRDPGLPIGVVTADCVPVLLEHRTGAARAALHAGWRGVFARIPEALFRALPEDLVRPAEWRVVLGPSIRACCYQVSPELLESFAGAFPDLSRSLLEPAPGRLDLIAVLLHQAEVLGMPEVRVEGGCTFCSTGQDGALYHSYRRGDRNTRQISIIHQE